jgi:hypothetical protein
VDFCKDIASVAAANPAIAALVIGAAVQAGALVRAKAKRFRELGPHSWGAMAFSLGCLILAGVWGW